MKSTAKTKTHARVLLAVFGGALMLSAGVGGLFQDSVSLVTGGILVFVTLVDVLLADRRER